MPWGLQEIDFVTYRNALCGKQWGTKSQQHCRFASHRASCQFFEILGVSIQVLQGDGAEQPYRGRVFLGADSTPITFQVGLEPSVQMLHAPGIFPCFQNRSGLCLGWLQVALP